MSIFNQDPARTLKYILITVWMSSAGLVVATALVAEPQNKKMVLAADRERSVFKPGAQLRCWQGGALLFEENNLVPTGAAKGQITSFSKTVNNSSVYLISEQNGLCELRSSR
jgi:hypothetical protein